MLYVERVHHLTRSFTMPQATRYGTGSRRLYANGGKQ